MEFVNEYTVLGGSWTFFGEPVFWGAVPDPSYSGPGRRYVLDSSIPSAERLPVGGITWRDAARFCNWLCNDKAPTITAISNGAYDTSTFGSGPNNTFTDQLRHNPGAPFWIPTLDEWAKASNYDPNRYGPGQGGWWEYSYRSDAAPIPGVPGTGQTSAGVALEHFGEWEIPLGAYSSQRSPWGLFDTSGGSSEWTEEVNSESNPVWRMLKGTAAGEFNLPDMERVWGFGSGFPQSVNQFGLRIASSVPAPGTTLFGLGLGLLITRRKRDD
jgi:formylglycine-generating enzyme required for sulfatase activity